MSLSTFSWWQKLLICLCPCCFEVEEKEIVKPNPVSTQQEKEINYVRQQKVEMRKRQYQMGFRSYSANEAAQRFVTKKKKENEISRKVIKTVNSGVEDFNNIVLNINTGDLDNRARKF